MKFQLLFGLLAVQCLQACARSPPAVNDLRWGLRPLVGVTFRCSDGFFAIPDYCGPDYYVCIAGSTYVSTCPVGEMFDLVTLTCTPAKDASCRSTFTCPQPDGFFPIPGSCGSEFYSCVAGNAYLEKCPGNSIFDPEALYCVPPENASCSGVTTTTQETTSLSTTSSIFTCPAIDGFYPIPGQCTGQFYVCIAGDLYVQSCPGTSIFDPVIEICVPAAVASCTNATSSSIPTTTTTSTSTALTSTTTTTSSTPTITTASTTPSSTSATTTTSATTSSTPTITTTSTTTKQTTSTATTTTEKTTSTAATTTEKTTPTASTTSSTTSFTTTQPTTTITPPGDFFCPASFGLYPVPGEQCSPNFYHCSNYIPYLKTCPPTTYFNPVLEVCDYPENIPGCQ